MILRLGLSVFVIERVSYIALYRMLKHMLLNTAEILFNVGAGPMPSFRFI